MPCGEFLLLLVSSAAGHAFTCYSELFFVSLCFVLGNKPKTGPLGIPSDYSVHHEMP